MFISILDSLWEVSIVDAQAPELLVDNTVCRGSTWFAPQKIYLSKVLTADTALRIIKHECAHACLYATQLKIPETFTEEDVCDFVAMYSELITDISNQIYDFFYLRQEADDFEVNIKS